MFGRKLGIGTGIVAAILVVAIAVPAGAQRPAGPAHAEGPAVVRTTPPAWLVGLQARSEGSQPEVRARDSHAAGDERRLRGSWR